MTTFDAKHSIGSIVMDDGTEYDLHVSYTSSKHEPLKISPTMTPEIQQQLQTLIKTMATAHAKASQKSFKELSVIHLTEAGALFPDKSLHSHDMPLQAPLKAEENYTRVDQLWKKTAHLLTVNCRETLEDCIEIPVSTTKPSAPPQTTETPKTVIDLTVTPNTGVEPSAPPASPPPSYRSNNPSPRPEATHRDQAVQGDTLPPTAAAAQGQAIRSNAVDENPEHYKMWGYKFANGTWGYALANGINGIYSHIRPLAPPAIPKPAPTKKVEIGHLPEGFQSQALETARNNIASTYFTLPVAQEPTKLSLIDKIRGKKQETPPAPSLPSFDNNRELLSALKAFFELIYKETQAIGIGAVLDAMNRECDALIRKLPESGSENYKDKLKEEFRKSLITFLKDRVKTTPDPQLMQEIWKIFNDNKRNPLLKEGKIVFTFTSLQSQ